MNKNYIMQHSLITTLTHHSIHTSIKDICIGLVILSNFFSFIKVVKITILYIHFAIQSFVIL
jgi:hypothetical protein